MTTLALDPSLRCTGWAIFDTTQEPALLIAAGTIKTEKQARLKTVSDILRTQTITRELIGVIQHHDVREVVTEWRGGSQSAAAAAALAIANTIVLVICEIMEIDINAMPASDAKKAVTGNRFAKKEEVIEAVTKAYDFKSYAHTKPEREAIADAIAIFIASDEKSCQNLLHRS